jgi:hypothetical protein
MNNRFKVSIQNIGNTFNKKSLITLIYYLILYILYICAVNSGDYKTGPCNIGFDLLLFLLIGIVGFLLLMLSMIQVVSQKCLTASFIINFVAVGTWVLIYIL